MQPWIPPGRCARLSLRGYRLMMTCIYIAVVVALLSAAVPTFASTETDVLRAARKAQQTTQRAEDQKARQARQQQIQDERAARQREAQLQRQAKQQQMKMEREAKQRQVQAQRQAEAEARQEALVRWCDAIQAWIDAGPVPVYTGYRPSVAAIITLLRDERFVPAFGQRYDEMTDSALQQLAQGASRCFDPPNGPLTTMPGPQRELVRTILSFTQRAANRQHLARAREADATLLRLALAATDLRPTAEDAKRLLEIAREGEEVFAMAAPAARERFVADLRTADTAVALPVLTAAVEEALASAQGLDGMQTLAALAHWQQPMFMPTGERLQEMQGMELRAENTRRIERRLEAIGNALATTERQRIDALGEGVVALEQGVSWHADYLQRVQPHVGRAKFLAELLPYFLQKRAQALTQGQDDLQRQVAGAANHDELQRLRTRYLLPQDQQTVPGMAILTAFATHAQAIDKHIALGRSVPVSEQDASTPTVSAAPRAPLAVAGEPSEDVMYELVRGVLDAAVQRQNALMGNCSKGLQADDPAMNQVCAIAMLYKGLTTGDLQPAVPPKILNFEKIGCAPALGKAGYLCDYQLAVEKRLNPEFVGPQAKLLLEGSSLKQARFVEGRNGWMMIYTEEAVQ